MKRAILKGFSYHGSQQTAKNRWVHEKPYFIRIKKDTKFDLSHYFFGGDRKGRQEKKVPKKGYFGAN